MSESEFDLDLEELSSAEDFLEYFGIDFDASVVHVNRLHILQRFHDYIADLPSLAQSEEEKRRRYGEALSNAYADFVSSDALTEKVFKVFRMHEPLSVEVPFADLAQQVMPGAAKV